MGRTMMVAALVLAALVLAAGEVAMAGAPTPPPPKAPAGFSAKLSAEVDAGGAPRIVATVEGAGFYEPRKYTLTETDLAKPLTMTASAVARYVDGNEPLGLVVVVEGHEMWMGNDVYRGENDPDRAIGTFAVLGGVLDDLGKAGPRGSLGELIVYGRDVKVKVPVGPLTALTGAALGAQKDYAGVTSRPMVAAINQAVADLAKMNTPRRLLLVLGDGSDTDPAGAHEQLRQLAKATAPAGIEMFAVDCITPWTEGVPSVIAELVGPGLKNASGGVAGIRTAVDEIIAHLQQRSYVTFPAYDAARGVGFQTDGNRHTFMLTIDSADGAPVTTLMPTWQPPAKTPWLYIALGGGAAVALLVATVVLVRRRRTSV
jgi:hypothetical protein